METRPWLISRTTSAPSYVVRAPCRCTVFHVYEGCYWHTPRPSFRTRRKCQGNGGQRPHGFHMFLELAIPRQLYRGFCDLCGLLWQNCQESMGGHRCLRAGMCAEKYHEQQWSALPHDRPCRGQPAQPCPIAWPCVCHPTHSTAYASEIQQQSFQRMLCTVYRSALPCACYNRTAGRTTTSRPSWVRTTRRSRTRCQRWKLGAGEGGIACLSSFVLQSSNDRVQG